MSDEINKLSITDSDGTHRAATTDEILDAARAILAPLPPRHGPLEPAHHARVPAPATRPSRSRGIRNPLPRQSPSRHRARADVPRQNRRRIRPPPRSGQGSTEPQRGSSHSCPQPPVGGGRAVSGRRADHSPTSRRAGPCRRAGPRPLRRHRRRRRQLRRTWTSLICGARVVAQLGAPLFVGFTPHSFRRRVA